MQRKNVVRLTVGIVLTPFLLFIILAILLYVPPIQNWAVKQVTSYASKQTGMDISVDHVKLVFPLDLGIEGFKMIQQNDSLPAVKDTVADVKRLVVDVQLWPLFKKKVEVDALEFNNLKFNTTNFVHEARVKGNIGQLYLKSHGIDLGKETIKVNDALLADANVNVELSDTVPPDTTKTENNWKINVDQLNIKNTKVTVHMPGDTLQVSAYMGKTEARNGYFDLNSGLYKVQNFNLADGILTYDNNFEPHTKGLDPNHISLTDVNIAIDTLHYLSPDISLSLRSCSFKEKSGINIEEFAGKFMMDSTKISLPAMSLRTPNSSIDTRLTMDLDAFDEKNPGRINLYANCTIGKQDIMRFLGNMPSGFIRRWPNQPLSLKAVVAGNTRNLNFSGVNIKLPSAFNINMRGKAANITEIEKLSASVNMDAKTYNLSFVNELLRAQGITAKIPANISLKGSAGISGKRYTADLTASEGGGRISVNGFFDANHNTYKALLSARNFRVDHFVPADGIGSLTGQANIKGAGTDIMSPRTKATVKANIEKFTLGEYNLDKISFDADIDKGHANAVLNSDNPLAQGAVALHALFTPKSISSSLSADIKNIDWYGLRLTESELSTALKCNVNASTDMKTLLCVNGIISDLAITDSSQTFRPNDLKVDIITSKDTTHFVTECGDFNLRFDGKGGYKKILAKFEEFGKELSAELDSKQINIVQLREKLPTAQLYFTTGKDNPLSRFIARKGFTFQDADIDLSSSPMVGLNGNVQLLELQNSSVMLDTIRFNIVSDSTTCTYNGQVRNNKDNKQYVFNALLDGYVFEKGSGANIRFYDAKDSLGVKLGFEASLEEKGMKIHLLTDDPILGYKKFKVNEDNFIYLGTDKRVSAKLQLMADDGTGVHIYSNDENTDALQDLTIGLNQFDLEKVLTVIPYMPNITGIMNGDFHIIQAKDAFSVSASMAVNNMTYERSRLGNISTEFVYMPQSDGTHAVDAVLSNNDIQIAELSGTYNSAEDGNLDVDMTMDRLPMRLLNGFIPDRMIRLKGYANGKLAINGPLSRPQANGELLLDSCYMRSSQYGIQLRLDDKPIRIVGSNLLFEKFNMYTSNNNPLTINGNVDFSDMNAMNMNLSMTGRDLRIIDSKENRRSIAFGKAFVDFFATMKGPMERLEMLGRVDVLGSTDMSYILRDSPLSTDNRMEELVKFVDFQDTVATVVEHKPLSGFKMDLTMNIARGAHVICYLNTDHSNYIDLMGGGSLRMQYGLTGDITLTGRYTLDNGEMKYSLPIIPLKTFTIRDGSYIEFTGDPMNPKLNITATERTKANVSSGGNQERTVEFDCGVVITKTLSDMGLEFTLSAPEDMTLNSELQSMSVEQRGRLAVTMLTTGMYLADGNTGGFSMNDALNSFLQSEINNITGSALRTLDLSFGMDNSTDASGTSHTDYSFKFSKRFWNNRIRIVVGGKVSTGSEMTNQNESFFDNVTLEYRLGNSSDKYVKLYYDNNAYDWLEGTIREYGVGFTWRRSLQNLKEMFSFKKKQTAPQAPADSTKNKKQ